MSSYSSESTAARIVTDEGECVLTYEPLSIQNIIMSVGDDGAGGTAVFIGTTRNSFKGKVVTHLEYQAYSKLAMKTMVSVVRDAHSIVARSDYEMPGTAASPLIRCAVHHRLGGVPVGQPSIVIAVSSPHRRESFQACEFILEEVKKKAQIWKREFYEGEKKEDAEWKGNH